MSSRCDKLSESSSSDVTNATSHRHLVATNAMSHLCLDVPNSLSDCRLDATKAKMERWGAGVETQKNVRGEIGGWGRVPFNETYAPSLSNIYEGA